mmetsp:Transcript_47779/g.76081  ORF Transcript_47779/g.76081 Transcript_47779/m.76081 type:complete len:215 (-) Transcript_47779:56-700(-)
MAGRDFANMVHPNAVVARREQERQEQLRLKRLSEIKLSSSRPGSARRQERPSRPSSRPSSAARSRASGASASRPSSAKPEASCEEKKTRLSPDEIQQQLIRQKLGPYQAAAAYAAVAAKSAIRSRGEPQVPVSFLTSPQKRMEDAWQHLPAGSEEERQALYEELQGWYFCPPSALETSKEAKSRPPMVLLEEAAAAVKVKNVKSGGSKPPLGRP